MKETEMQQIALWTREVFEARDDSEKIEKKGKMLLKCAKDFLFQTKGDLCQVCKMSNSFYAYVIVETYRSYQQLLVYTLTGYSKKHTKT